LRIYVGNLGFDFTEEDLKKLFSDHGKVESASIARDRETQRSKGFAFIDMPSQAEAQAAIMALNGREVQSRSLTVNEARPREERVPTNRAPGGYRPSTNRSSEPRTDKKGPAKRNKRQRR
jgi:RNA recognition motif-containing protein